MAKIKSIDDVVQYQLCTGCGVCAAAEPDRFEMVDAVNYGRRPKVKPGAPPESGQAFKLCPGHRLEHTTTMTENHDASLFDAWGPVMAVWEGHAADEEIRFKGSSGGAATALALFTLQSGRATTVLHTAASKARPYLNETVNSTKREDLIATTGSRYAPASPCEGLAAEKLADAPGNVAFIGKPCDAAAAQNWERERGESLAIRIAFFCAGAPSTAGNLALLKRQGATPDEIISLHYRGEGWPGKWRVRWSDHRSSELSYSDSWGFLQKYRQWRCYICPDHTGEFADIAVGDPWYREIQAGEHGSSLIVARTQRGLDFIKEAESAGHLVLTRQDNTLLPRSQPNLLRARGALWGRLVALRLCGAPTPIYRGIPSFRFWKEALTIREKLSSLAGTAKRVFRKDLNRRVDVGVRPDARKLT